MLLYHLYHILCVLDSPRIYLDVLRYHVLLCAHIIDLHLLLIDLAGYVTLLHVVLVDHAGLLLDLVEHFLLLLLKRLVLLLFFFNFVLNGLGVSLEFFQVGLEMLNRLSQVFVTLSNTDRFVTVFHILALKSFDLVFLLFLLLLHDEELALKLVVLTILLLDSKLCAGYLTVHLLNLLGDTLDLRDQTLSRLNLLILDLVFDVLFIVLEQVYLGLQSGTTLLDGFNIAVNI